MSLLLDRLHSSPTVTRSSLVSGTPDMSWGSFHSYMATASLVHQPPGESLPATPLAACAVMSSPRFSHDYCGECLLFSAPTGPARETSSGFFPVGLTLEL